MSIKSQFCQALDISDASSSCGIILLCESLVSPSAFNWDLHEAGFDGLLQGNAGEDAGWAAFEGDLGASPPQSNGVDPADDAWDAFQGGSPLEGTPSASSAIDPFQVSSKGLYILAPFPLTPILPLSVL